jgi:hypothetical protein
MEEVKKLIEKDSELSDFGLLEEKVVLDSIPALKDSLKINSNQREAMYMLITGVSKEEVARSLGIGYKVVNRMLENPLFRAELARMQHRLEEKTLASIAKSRAVEVAKAVIREAAPDSAKNLVKLSNEAESEQTKLKANTEILDRAGVGGRVETSATNNNVYIEMNEGMAAFFEQTGTKGGTIEVESI